MKKLANSLNIYKLPFAKKFYTGPAPAPFHYEIGEPYAVDFRLDEETPIFAAFDGTVLQVKDGFGKGGESINFQDKANLVLLEHENGEKSLYTHLKKGVLVKEGEVVKAGQVLAYLGRSGRTTYAHLHFAVYNKTDQAPIPVRFAVNGGVQVLFSPNGKIIRE